MSNKKTLKTFSEIHESLADKFRNSQTVERQYTAPIKTIRKRGLPGELDKQTKLNGDGSGTVPAGYSKFRAGALVWAKSPSPIGISAPGVGDYPSQFDRASRTHDDFQDEINKLYRNINPEKKKVKNKKQVSENILDEGKNIKPPTDPPYVLILKRHTVKTFPNNIKVALYYNDKLNKYISIPYGNIDSTIYTEGIDEKFLVSSFINIFYNLSEENKIKFIEMLNENEESYNKIKHFILENGTD